MGARSFLNSGRVHREEVRTMKHEEITPKVEESKLEVEELEQRIAPSQPPGLLGYEGQPGNQGGHGGNGLQGYEGQPGNQGGN